MDEQRSTPFDGRQQFQAQLLAVFARAGHTLQLFDPDFALWQLGTREVDAQLRRLLINKGRIELVAHDNSQLLRHSPRFLTLLADFSHAIECRLTSKSLRQLTDSFCIADGQHMVRRFHSDHLRGEVVWDTPAALQVSAERFAGIWAEAGPGLSAGTTGL